MTLGQAIHEYREDHGLSMEKFSSMSGLSKAYISILERNKTPHGNIPAPSIDTYVRVAKTMSMDVNDLLALVDDRISLVNKTDPNLLSYQGTDKIVPFSEPEGRVFREHPDTIRRHVHAVCKLAGISDTTVHGLRHANAAVMIALGVVDKYAMARNGWTSDYTFKQIYGYVFPEGANETDSLVNSYFEDKIKLRTDLRTDK